MIDEETILKAGRLLASAASSPARVILFGSRARGEAGADSDVDFLVIEREVADRFGEAVRLNRVLGELRLPADVVVVSEQHVTEWGEVANTMLREALREGRVLVDP